MSELCTGCDGRWEARQSDWGVDLVAVIVVQGDEVHTFGLFVFNDEARLM